MPEFVFGRKASDEFSIEELYGEYKSDSQLFFTDKLDESRQCSLWLVTIFIILVWNTLIFKLQIQSFIVQYLGGILRCEVPDLEHTNWTFDQIQRISRFRGRNDGCYIYDFDYQLLVDKPFDEALNMTLSWKQDKLKLCSKLKLPEQHSRYTYMLEWELFCTLNFFKLHHATFIGSAVGFIASGFLADIYGRRTTIIMTLPVSVAVCFLKPFAPTYWILFLLTFISEASVSSSAYVGSTLFLEIVNSKIRAFMVALIWMGLCVAGFLKAAILFNYPKWLTKEIYWTVTSTFLVPICTEWLIPESPHWLICRKDWKNMFEVLQEMNYPRKVTINADAYEDYTPLPQITVKEIVNVLWKPVFRKKMLFGGSLFILTYFLYYTESSRIIFLVDSEAKYFVIEGVCYIVNVGLIPLLLINVTRPMAICSSLLIVAFFYCASTMYHQYSETAATISSICLLFAQNAAIMGALLVLETFPTRVRCTAVGICRSTGSVMVLVAMLIRENIVISDAMVRYGWTIYAAAILVAAFLCIFVRETGNIPLPDTDLQAIIHY